MAQTYCKNCGQPLAENMQFCQNCGTAVNNTQSTDSNTQTSQQGYTQSSQGQAYGGAYTSQTGTSSGSYGSTGYQTPQAQPGYSYPNYTTPTKTTVSVGEYILMFIVMAIPIVGFIMLLVWAFGSDGAPSKKNFARATLIMMVIGLVLGLLFSVVIGNLLRNIFY